MKRKIKNKYKMLLTNILKNANIYTVARHSDNQWRGGRVGLWHQS